MIAGHVDSATEGIGFFARLRSIKVGEMVTLRAGSHALKYRVTSVREVPRRALATDSQAFDAERPASPGADHLHRALSPRPRRIRQQSCGGRQAAGWLASASAGTACVTAVSPRSPLDTPLLRLDRYTVTQSPPSTGSGRSTWRRADRSSTVEIHAWSSISGAGAAILPLAARSIPRSR